MRSFRRFEAAFVLGCMLFCGDIVAGGRRRPVASPAEALTIVFAEAPLLDLGTIASRDGRAAIVTRTLTLRIGPPSSAARGTATVRAFLESPDHCGTIRIDGVPLRLAPQVIGVNVPVGIDTTHRMEVEVPVSAPEGSLVTAIGFEATTN